MYGLVRGGTNPGGTSKHKFVGNLGHPSEDETGLLYMQARFMDPVTGRFISEDPARDSINWYQYCDGNPVNNADPNGQFVFFIGGLICLLLGTFLGSYLRLNSDTFNIGVLVTIGFRILAAGLAIMQIYQIVARAAPFFRRWEKQIQDGINAEKQATGYGSISRRISAYMFEQIVYTVLATDDW